MDEIDIARLYAILADSRKLDPKTALRILRQILDILQEKRRTQ